MTWFVEPFALGFQQRALIGGLLAGVMSAVIGTWLVLRGMSFFGDAFVHGIVPGIAAAVLLDINPTFGAAAAALVMVVAIETIHRQTLLREDTAIGLLFVGMLALGVVIISRSASYAGSLTTILFGDVLGINATDLLAQAILAVVVIVAGVLMYRPLLVLALNRQKAEVLGLRPGLAHATLLILIALAVIGSYQAVGTLLVFGLLVGPPAAAALVTRSIPAMMVTAAAFAALSVVVGLQISYYLDTAGSATMALIPVLLFFVLLTARTLFRRVQRTFNRARPQRSPAGADV